MCFVVLKVRVRKDGGDKKGLSKEKGHPAGSRLHVYEPSDDIKPCFGHLALLYRCVRMLLMCLRAIANF